MSPEQPQTEKTLNPDLIFLVTPQAEKLLNSWGVEIQGSHFWTSNKISGSNTPVRRPFLFYADALANKNPTRPVIKMVKAFIPKGRKDEVIVECYFGLGADCDYKPHNKYRVYIKHLEENLVGFDVL